MRTFAHQNADTLSSENTLMRSKTWNENEREKDNKKKNVKFRRSKTEKTEEANKPILSLPPSDFEDITFAIVFVTQIIVIDFLTHSFVEHRPTDNEKTKEKQQSKNWFDEIKKEQVKAKTRKHTVSWSSSISTSFWVPAAGYAMLIWAKSKAKNKNNRKASCEWASEKNNARKQWRQNQDTSRRTQRGEEKTKKKEKSESKVRKLRAIFSHLHLCAIFTLGKVLLAFQSPLTVTESSATEVFNK